ncbi:MAG TPA: hypothetical protein DDY25_07065 [Peptococcaceae bacterium]|nr:hypothetical protein [Peptococcaceae bacterium]
MDDFGDNDIFGILFEEPETEVRNCENCNSGIKTKEGLKCCLNKKEECIGDGEYKHWSPVVVIGDELSES